MDHFKDLAESQRLLIQTLMDENARLRAENQALAAAREMGAASGEEAMTGTPSAGFLRDLAELQQAVKNRRDLRAETLSGGMES